MSTIVTFTIYNLRLLGLETDLDIYIYRVP